MHSPLTQRDMHAAGKLFGPNVVALKGKTPYGPLHTCNPTPDNVPRDIRHKYRSITVAIDIMYVNKLPFLVTISHGLHFGTVEYLTNRQVPTVSRAVKGIMRLYHGRGFTVGAINADPKFYLLKQQLPQVPFNICAQNEHVPTVERFIRTIKE